MGKGQKSGKLPPASDSKSYWVPVKKVKWSTLYKHSSIAKVVIPYVTLDQDYYQTVDPDFDDLETGPMKDMVASAMGHWMAQLSVPETVEFTEPNPGAEVFFEWLDMLENMPGDLLAKQAAVNLGEDTSVQEYIADLEQALLEREQTLEKQASEITTLMVNIETLQKTVTELKNRVTYLKTQILQNSLDTKLKKDQYKEMYAPSKWGSKSKEEMYDEWKTHGISKAVKSKPAYAYEGYGYAYEGSDEGKPLVTVDMDKNVLKQTYEVVVSMSFPKLMTHLSLPYEFFEDAPEVSIVEQVQHNAIDLLDGHVSKMLHGEGGAVLHQKLSAWLYKIKLANGAYGKKDY